MESAGSQTTSCLPQVNDEVVICPHVSKPCLLAASSFQHEALDNPPESESQGGRTVQVTHQTVPFLFGLI